MRPEKADVRSLSESTGAYKGFRVGKEYSGLHRVALMEKRG